MVFAIGACTAFAQTETRQVKEPERIVFKPHWFMQLQGGAGYTVGEASFGDLISPAASVSLGYQFSPVFGLRVNGSGWQAKGGWVNPSTVYQYKYLQGNVDAMFNLSNLFCGYDYRRGMNLYAFVGGGVNARFKNGEAMDLAAKGYDLRYLWTEHKFAPVGRAGLGADFRLSDRVYFNLEANANVLTDKFNSKKAGNADWQFNALAGFTIKLGKPYIRIPAVYYEPEPVAPAQPVVKEEPVKVVEPAPAPVVVEPLRVNIFFQINRSVIRPSETSKIDELVMYLTDHSDAKVAITGYADKNTGNARVNERLSRQRAEAVAAALKAQGIAADRISYEYKGDTVQPFTTAEENRVSICVAQ